MRLYEDVALARKMPLPAAIVAMIAARVAVSMGHFIENTNVVAWNLAGRRLKRLMLPSARRRGAPMEAIWRGASRYLLYARFSQKPHYVA